MKRTLAIVLAIITCFSLSACAVKNEEDLSYKSTTTEQTTTEKAQTQTTSTETTTTEETTTVYTEEFTFCVPSGSEVTVNGEKLDSKTAVAADVPEVLEYVSQLINDVPEFVTYTADLEPGNINVSGTDADGNALVFSNTDNAYTASGASTQSLIDEVSERVSDGLYAWGKHFINFADARPYVHYDSELYGMIFGSADYDWINNTFYNYEYVSDCSYSEFEISNYVSYGSECFTVDVKYTLDVNFYDADRHDYNQTLDATMVWIPEGDTWSIADLFYKPITMEYPEYEGIEFITLNEKTYTGTLIIIEDPSRVSAGAISDLGSTTGLKINAMLEELNNNGINAIAGINGGDFIDTGSYIYTGTPVGLVITDGEVVFADEGYGATYRITGLTNENKLVYGYYTVDEALELGIRDAIAAEDYSGCWLVADGQRYSGILDPADYGCGKNARTAIGQREDGAILLMCINGRQSNSLGATFYDVADEMIKYGAVTAAAMDGGSSSQMGAKFADGSYRYINNPFTPAYGPRACPTFWLVK